MFMYVPHRRIYQDVEATVGLVLGGVVVGCTGAGHHTNTKHRWFVLKGGKIFWFKSDIVTPVWLLYALGCVVVRR